MRRKFGHVPRWVWGERNPRSSLNPQPSTPTPQPSTLDTSMMSAHTLRLAPCTLHPAPCTLHPAPSTLNPQHRHDERGADASGGGGQRCGVKRFTLNPKAPFSPVEATLSSCRGPFLSCRGLFLSCRGPFLSWWGRRGALRRRAFHPHP